MQIHELDTYMGTPSETDFMAVDDGTETFKIPLPNVGVSTQMTLEEAEAGTETAPRVISPAVLNSFVAEESVPVVDVSSEIALGDAWSELYKHAYKIGNIVYFAIEATTNTYVAETEYTIATLSSGIRPKYTVAMFGAVTNGNYIVKSTPAILCKIGGTITVRTTNTNGSYWFINGWYYI